MSPSIESRENRNGASEVKFLVSAAVAAQLRDWVCPRLARDCNTPDGSDTYRISSLYFDTLSFDVCKRNGSYGRAKFRIRRYGNSEQVFLERKLRTKKMLTKRRTLVSIDTLSKLAEPVARRDWPGFWFHRRLLRRGLLPACEVSYTRLARVAMTQAGPIRFTLDEQLRGSACEGLSFSTGRGELLLPGQAVVEMKFCGSLPALFKNAIEEFALNVQRFSKYRHAATTLGIAPTEESSVTKAEVYA